MPILRILRGWCICGKARAVLALKAQRGPGVERLAVGFQSKQGPSMASSLLGSSIPGAFHETLFAEGVRKKVKRQTAGGEGGQAGEE
jgi:hypothetical protein